MKRNKFYLSIICILTMTLVLTGCGDGGEDGESTDFSYSDGIDDNGYWEGITAKDYVTMADYNGVEIPKENYTVTEGAVQTEIDSIVSSYTTTEEVKDRAVKDGETVNIDYIGRVDGEEFEGGSTEGNGTEIILGEAGYIDDFEDQIVGHKPGETFDVEVTFPDDYDSEDLQGKDAVFETTVNHIVEEVTPELTDDFVKENLEESNGWTTIAEMEKGVKENLKNTNIESYINEYLTDNFKVSSVPESILEYQNNAMEKYYEDMAETYGVEVSDVLANMGVESMDALIESEAESNKAYSESSLILQAIAEDLDIKVTEEDVEAYFEEKNWTDNYSTYKESYGMPYLKQSAMKQEVIDHIKDNGELLK